MNAAFSQSVELFPWASEAQKEGYLNLFQYLLQLGVGPREAIDPVAAYFIQRDHESNEYWRDLVGDQVTGLQDQIRSLQNLNEAQSEKISDLRQTIDDLRMSLKAQTVSIQFLSESFARGIGE